MGRKSSWKFAFAGLLGISLAAGASAADLALPDCASLNQLWLSRYHAKLKIMWAKRPIDCASPAVSYERAFAEAAYVLENTRFNVEAVPAGYEAPPASMLDFVTDKYRGLTIDPGASFPATDVAQKVLYFYPDVAKETGFSVVGNLIHESRHADGNEFLHVTCVDGPNQGKAMCDNGLGDSFSQGGPHRIASLYFAWVAARSNWSATARASMRGLAEWCVRTRINATEAERTAWIAKYLHDW